MKCYGVIDYIRDIIYEQNKKILNWMLKYGVRDVQSIGKIMNEYYLNYDEVMDLLKRGLSPESLLR